MHNRKQAQLPSVPSPTLHNPKQGHLLSVPHRVTKCPLPSRPHQLQSPAQVTSKPSARSPQQQLQPTVHHVVLGLIPSRTSTGNERSHASFFLSSSSSDLKKSVSSSLLTLIILSIVVSFVWRWVDIERRKGLEWNDDKEEVVMGKRGALESLLTDHREGIRFTRQQPQPQQRRPSWQRVPSFHPWRGRPWRLPWQRAQRA